MFALEYTVCYNEGLTSVSHMPVTIIQIVYRAPRGPQ